MSASGALPSLLPALGLSEMMGLKEVESLSDLFFLGVNDAVA
jgi:hypothetical protein